MRCAGIQDQRAAMVWTQKNIASFGGDPNRVFIVGQSAGANSVSQHLVRPKSWVGALAFCF
jgi:carboxylesterase type B